MTEYKPGDIVRIVAPPGGTGHIGMIGSYIGQEGRIIHKHPTEDLWQIELDVPRKPAAFGGRLDAPTFVVRGDMIEPDTTQKMIDLAEKLLHDEIGADTWWACDEEQNRAARADLAVKLYRAMRAARFER